jgi:hypothetical protein
MCHWYRPKHSLSRANQNESGLGRNGICVLVSFAVLAFGGVRSGELQIIMQLGGTLRKVRIFWESNLGRQATLWNGGTATSDFSP